MREDTEATIATAIAHLGRFAFFTRDNPYASVRAGERLPRKHYESLGALLEGGVTVEEWLASDLARALIDEIAVGCLPRDLQLTGDRSVAVTSVHAFVHAPLFWWVVSVLWCMTVGRAVDPLLDDGIKGYRLHPKFMEEPSSSGLMFRDPIASYNAWKQHVVLASREKPGQILAANTVDVADFYYSVTTGPMGILRDFAEGSRPPGAGVNETADHALTALLEELHFVYASRSAAIDPRAVPADASALMPLPVGLPSSRILANMIVSLAITDLGQVNAVVALAAYADDLVVLTPVLPTPLESISGYFERLKILDANDGRLKCPRARAHAVLAVNIEKSASSYSRSVGASDEGAGPDAEPDEAQELGQLDPYLEAEVGPEWGGPLRTVLRAPQRREREPRALERELEVLIGEIGVGLDAEMIGVRLQKLLEGLDTSLFLRLRRYWADLAVAGVAANGRAGAVALTRDFVATTKTLELAEDAPPQQLPALLAGLRASWIQAIALALAVAMSEQERAALGQTIPQLVEDASVESISTSAITNYATRIRRRGLVPAAFVSVPLSEFTPWNGPLLGEGVFAAFLSWALGRAGHLLETVTGRVPRAARFIPLHEACLAVHLWANPGSREWLDHAIALVRSQPLVDQAHIVALRDSAATAMELSEPVLPVDDEKRGLQQVRFAMPSFRVRVDQLQATLKDDKERQASIIGESRRSTQIVVSTAAKRKADVLVLPEWAVLPEQLAWLMSQSRRAGMLIVAGQSPTVTNGEYSNRLWTGIPLKDPAGRRACLVPPPREKRYLSPHEQKALDDVGIKHVPGGEIPIYRWRGLGFASLICFEFADIATRHRLRANADLLTVSSWNRDWRYFDAIQDSTTRDNYCVTFCVNTSDYPGTRITRPTRNEMAVVASVHGSDYPAVVMRELDVLPVVAARAQKRDPSEVLTEPPSDDAALTDYKSVPPVW